MKKILFFVLLLLVACAPAAPIAPKTAPEKASVPVVQTKEEVTSPPQPAAPKTSMNEGETANTPLEPSGSAIDPYSELGCDGLLSAQEFAEACSQSPDDFQVTHKIGTKNCYVNAKSKSDNRLTAGVSLTGFADAPAAIKEFERRLVVLKVGADKSVGERAYTFPKVDRQTINFVRNQFIVEVGSDTHLCSKESLLNVARTVDNRLR
jgi:hypothetical protein